MNILSVKLQKKVNNELGLDIDDIKRIYLDFKKSVFAFERHFVEDEPLEYKIMKEIEKEFILHQRGLA